MKSKLSIAKRYRIQNIKEKLKTIEALFYRNRKLTRRTMAVTKSKKVSCAGAGKEVTPTIILT